MNERKKYCPYISGIDSVALGVSLSLHPNIIENNIIGRTAFFGNCYCGADICISKYKNIPIGMHTMENIVVGS